MAGMLGGALVGCRSLSQRRKDEGQEAEMGNCPFKNKCKLSRTREREQSRAGQSEPARKLQPCAALQTRSR